MRGAIIRRLLLPNEKKNLRALSRVFFILGSGQSKIYFDQISHVTVNDSDLHIPENLLLGPSDSTV